MKTLITSCGRFDLLDKTIKSLKHNQQYDELNILINEDLPIKELSEKLPHDIGGDLTGFNGETVYLTDSSGQHNSIEKFLNKFQDLKYYLHCEDDWQFNNSYNWIQASIDIMEADPTIIKVLCNSDSPHPCQYNCSISYCNKNNPEIIDIVISFGYLQPWTNNNIVWHGFSWNPGVTRLDLLRKFMPFDKYEQYVAKSIYDAGYKVVRLENGVCHHIGQGRSTHE